MDEKEYTAPLVETPVGQLVDLTEIGIDEVDNGICLDTPENRRILRENKFLYSAVFDDNGNATDYIHAIPKSVDEEHRISTKAALFEDARDKNSEYLMGLDLLLDDDALRYVPAWVATATRKYLEIERKRDETGKHVWPYLVSAPGRCVALKSNGTRCMNWHNGTATSGMKCKMHIGRGGEVAVNYREKARSRMDSLSILAVDELEKLLLNATSEPVRAKAAEMILDRVGIRAGYEIESNVNVEVHAASTVLEQRLQRLAIAQANRSEGDEDIIEAETVEIEDGKHE